MSRRDPRPSGGLQQAFDEARFGTDRILNLRATMPTAAAAVARAEAWLRERQMGRAGEVLVITGRGRGSEGGVSVVREAVLKLLHSLRRRNVVLDHTEHTAGSFVVRLAPVRALFEAPARARHPAERRPPLADPASLGALDPHTRSLLRELSLRALAALGVSAPAEPFVRDEMVRQFGALSAGLPADSADHEAVLQQALERAIEEFDEG
ncbi:MAG TPA: hypothetical protein VKA84_23370 [Gemmatimonadaceae bacterium]|nr:hypothetical protein [Gemmatimonadaceae bacterium]